MQAQAKFVIQIYKILGQVHRDAEKFKSLRKHINVRIQVRVKRRR